MPFTTSFGTAAVPRLPVGHRRSHPAFVIEGSVAEHFEILRLVRRGCSRVGLVKGIARLTPSIGVWVMPSTACGTRDYPSLQGWSARCRSHDGTDCGCRPRPRCDPAMRCLPLRGSTKVRRRPAWSLKRRVDGPGPPNRMCGIGEVRTPHVVEILQLVVDSGVPHR